MSEINYEEYKVHPAAAIFPMMDESELQELAADIKVHGLREWIELYRGQIIDGRNRLAACKIAGVEPTYSEYEDYDETKPFDVVALVISKNLHRRHLTSSQRAAIAAQLLGVETTNAKQRQKQGREKLPDPSNAGRARDKAADMLGVSGRSVAKAAFVMSNGSPELIQLVKDGEVSVSAAADASEVPIDVQQRAARTGKAGVMLLAKQQRRKRRQSKRRKSSAALPAPNESSRLDHHRSAPPPALQNGDRDDADSEPECRLHLPWFGPECDDRGKILECADGVAEALEDAIKAANLVGDLLDLVDNLRRRIKFWRESEAERNGSVNVFEAAFVGEAME